MAISVKEAFATILNLKINQKYEISPIEKALGRISAEDIKAKLEIPRFNNSAMDGYAILYEDMGKNVEIKETIFAGDDSDFILRTGTCAKIMTGARVPNNCDAVVPKEDCEVVNENTIKIPTDIDKNQHIRFLGEDINKDETIIKRGEEIKFSQVTLLASQGLSHIKIFKKPKVVVFASGEELKLHYEKVEDYQIYNSNTPTFISRCTELGCEVDFIGQAHDSVESIKNLLENSLDADLVITSGGVSVGDADFTKEAINALEYENIFDGIKIKPGKPTVLGKINNTYILNLPGNPLAGALIFELFGKILIQRLIGSNEIYHNYINTKIKEELRNKKGRITIIPGFFDGEYFQSEQKRSPGMVSTLSRCNSLIVLNEEVSVLKENSSVKVLPINWKFFEKDNKDFLTNE